MKYISSSSYLGRAGRRRSAGFVLAFELGLGPWPWLWPWVEMVGVVLTLLLFWFLILKASVEIEVAEEDIEAREAVVGVVEVLEMESYRSRENGLGEDSVEGGRRDDDACDEDEKEKDGRE